MTLMILTVIFGSRLSNTAVLMSVINASTGVEIAGKPKPIAPCDRPATKIVRPMTAHTHGARSGVINYKIATAVALLTITAYAIYRRARSR